MLQFRRMDRSRWTGEATLLFSLGSELGGDVSSHKVLVLNICRGNKRVKKVMGHKAKQRRGHRRGQTECFYWEMLIGLVRMGDYKNTPQD